MSSKRNVISIFALAVGLFAGSTAISAQEVTPATPVAPEKAEKAFKGGRGFGRHKMGGHGTRGMFFGDLNLTDAQKEQIKQIREANKPDQAGFESIRPLMEAKRSGTITPEQEAQLKAFKEDRKAKGQAVHDQIMNVLTVEQKAQLEKNKADMKLKREEFRKQRELRRQEKQNATPTETKKVG